MSVKVYSPEDLADELANVDAQLDTHLVDVVAVANVMEPRLDRVLIYPVEPGELDWAPVPELTVYESGDMLVTFGIDLEPYNLLLTGYMRTRFRAFRDSFRSRDRELTLQNIVEICVAHELGHAAMTVDLWDEIGEDCLDSPLLWDDYWHLPLALPSSEAMGYWQNNTGGYRSCLESYGYT